jgi:hypothetical protein
MERHRSHGKNCNRDKGREQMTRKERHGGKTHKTNRESQQSVNPNQDENRIYNKYNEINLTSTNSVNRKGNRES